MSKQTQYEKITETIKRGGSMIIERIIFLQGTESGEALEIYENHGPEGALQFLDQWFNPGENYQFFSELAAGSSDHVFEIGDYVLTVNTRLGYIGLEFIHARTP